MARKTRPTVAHSKTQEKLEEGGTGFQPVRTQVKACGYRFVAAEGGGATFSCFGVCLGTGTTGSQAKLGNEKEMVI
jgi:hypothetical protein